MGVGFKHSHDYGKDSIYHNPGVAPATKGSGVDVSKWIRSITAIIGTLVLLGGLIWGSAAIVANMASQDDLDKVEDRITNVEKNDLVQTVILEQIKSTLEKIDKKLDHFIESK